MRSGPVSFSLLPLSLCLLAAARLHHSLVPEDPYAFPKYKVTFLNGLPVLNETAQRWLQEGLSGGELEFLEQPWRESPWQTSPFKGIEGGQDSEPAAIPDVRTRLISHAKIRTLIGLIFCLGSFCSGICFHITRNEAWSANIVLMSYSSGIRRPCIVSSG